MEMERWWGREGKGGEGSGVEWIHVDISPLVWNARLGYYLSYYLHNANLPLLTISLCNEAM